MFGKGFVSRAWSWFRHPSVSHLIHSLTPPPGFVGQGPKEQTSLCIKIFKRASSVNFAQGKMAAATATGYAIPAFTVASTITSSKTDSSKPKNKVSVRRLKLFGGLKPENKVMNLGVPHSTEQQFGRLLTVCNAFRGKSRGGALTSTCDHISETIFRVVPIMSGLVLVGVALGFVLLRVEAALEESE